VRKAQIALIVVFVFLAGVVPVQAQGILRGGYRPSSWEGWYYYIIGDQVHMLQADNIEYVRRTMNIGRRAQMRRVTDDLAQSGPYVGLPGQNGFYPLYQCSKGQRLRRGIGTALLGAGVGYIVGHTTKFGEWEGALTGAGIAGGLALYLDANKCSPVNNQMVVIDDPSDVQSEQAPQVRPAQGRNNGWNERLRDQANAGGNPWFGSYRGCLEQGLFTLKNETGEVIRVYQNGQPFAVLGPRDSECGEPFASYDAEAISAVSDGYTATAGVARSKPEGRKGGVWIWR